MALGQSPTTAILRLPDELLASVLQESVHVEYKFWRDDDSEPFLKPCDAATARALISTCRRFQRLVTPLLYAHIEVRCNGAGRGEREVANARRTRLLHRTFRTNTSLWMHCRRLEIGFSYGGKPLDRESPVQNLMYIACDCLNWLTNTIDLRIIALPSGLLEEDGLTTVLLPTGDDLCYLIRLATDNLPHLRHLDLHTCNEAMLALPTVIAGLSGLKPNACLRTLDLSGITHIGTDDDWKLLRAQAGTSPLSVLKLRNFTQGVQALEALVLWPAKLTSFEFSMPFSDHYSGEGPLTRYNLGVLQQVLLHQKNHICYIGLQELVNQGLYGFDVTDFHSLKTLTLGHDTTGTDSSSIANLVAPNCEVFCWDMVLEDQQCPEKLGSFNQPEEDWLRAFAQAAIARKSALRHIKVLYYPESDAYLTEEALKSLEYPWDRMDRLAQEIQPYGIHLSYSAPNISRGEFDEMVSGP
ncbi:unnamed protein product [Clonostachys byssicola]|uniref:F-box domain-containing protein n=1 Tax=Clonostachys byssicola TaxID=160290 RepID=A0A9N9XXV8_9HYPO|nr:unnamed protein product [Clonostachys byssicola]